jgi:CRISPR-associated protein Cmr5
MDMPGANTTQEPPRTPPLALARAKHALDAIENLPGRTPREVGNYRGYVEALPANILKSGLGQALAMERAGADKDKGHRLLFGHMQDWLTTGWPNSPYREGPDRLLRAIVDGGQPDYVRAQAEALAYLEWLKKFAVAFLEKPDSDATDPAAAQGRGEEQ